LKLKRTVNCTEGEVHTWTPLNSCTSVLLVLVGVIVIDGGVGRGGSGSFVAFLHLKYSCFVSVL